uniref:Uncharacterized protein n=1 Tax=Chenopodium quinoa TaxID=63459 RepID=A0A803MVU8_CHEQI
MMRVKFDLAHTLLNVVKVLSLSSSHHAHTVGDEDVAAETKKIALPGCPDKCGNVTIPYPFRVGDKCHCHHPQDGNDGVITKDVETWTRIPRFALSRSHNIVGAIGCDTIGIFSGVLMNSSIEFGTECLTSSTNKADVRDECAVVGCREIPIPDGVTDIILRAARSPFHSEVNKFNLCGVAFVVANDFAEKDKTPLHIQNFLQQSGTSLRNYQAPIVYNWSIGINNCTSAKENKKYYLCKENSTCYDDQSVGGWGYRCQCELWLRG